MIKTGINQGGLRDGETWTHVICDHSRTILDDGVCLLPGYVEVANGELFQHFSDDPNNEIAPYITDHTGKAIGPNPKYQLGMMKNRVEFRRVEGPQSAPEGCPDGHFLDIETMYRHLAMLQSLAPTVVGLEEDVVESMNVEEPAPSTEPGVEEEPVGEEETPVVEEVGGTTDQPLNDGDAPSDVEDSEQTEDTDTVPEVQPADSEGTDTIEVDTPVIDVVDFSEEQPMDEPTTDTTPEEVPEPEVEAVETPAEEVTDTPSEDPTPTEEAPVTDTPDPSPSQLVDVNGIMRCPLCMTPEGAMDRGVEAHMNAHNPDFVEEEPVAPEGDMMTTDTTV